MKPSQRSDKTGTFAGIPYDGKLTKLMEKINGGMAWIRRNCMHKTTH
jgi:hypothetical protein